MAKTAFSKGQLIQLHGLLTSNKLLPCDKIGVYTDPINSGSRSIYNVLTFVKGKRFLQVGFITKTYPKNEKLKEQLYQYFGVENE